MNVKKENFQKAYVLDNIRRGKILAATMILFECVLACSDIVTSLLKVDKRFHFNSYFIMYSTMICIKELAESIRQRVCEHKISDELDALTVSIGASAIPISDRDDVSRVMKLADQALYAAKNSGRNCVRNICEESDS